MQEAAAIRTIGKYKILGTLGRGAMGVVYRAQDPEIGRIVAIKILRKLPSGAALTNAMALDRFKVEARSAGNLRHPHIITVFDVNIEGDVPYIVMDYIEGEGLDAVIQRQSKLDSRQMVHYLWQVASGLDYAHSRAVIHRDIKPSNILVDKSENVFLLDFGVASLGESSTPEEPVMGTPSYMSPEQILHRQLDYKSDLFSLGVVAFECLTGQKPFPGNNFSEIVNNILNSRPLSIVDVAPELPLALEVEIQRALAKNRDDRFKSAEDMVSAFGKALGFDIQAGGQAAAPRKRRLSDWRNVIAQSRADAGIQQPAQQKARKRNDTPRELSPWRPERGVSASSFTLTAAPQSTVRPGEMYLTSEDTLLRGAPVGNRMRSMTTFFGAVCLICSVFLFWSVYRTSDDSPLDLPTTGTTTLVEDIDRAVDGGVEFASLASPRVEPVPAGRPVFEMSDRQLLGVLVAEGMSDSLTMEALREAKTRRVAELVEASTHLLNRDSYIIRIETLKILADLGDKRVVPYVVVVLDDHDPLVRRWAAKTLAKLGDRRALGYLQARIVKEDLEEVRGDIRKAIERITGVPYSK
ncbi:MAG: protein kinase [Deltaproteobacteria bacterium]|nr:protein kinase [Deltaproteobacteria bacterium]